MYCPGCGSEERQKSQYCRACGTDLGSVRVSLERPDSVTASAVTAREEIGRVFAEKIREVEDSRDLKRIAEDVLPQIEKFLESPEEKRLRRMRAGVITAASGLGVTLLVSFMLTVVRHSPDPDALPLAMFFAGLGVVAFAIGLGLVLNGMLFTKPRTELKDKSPDARTQNLLDSGYAPPQLRPAAERPDFRSPTTSDLAKADLRGSSVTEHTTHHLKREP
ncbi:MAG: hypothetical protein JWM21_4650 [Acidobacteria bacterium]|nr:hypothetical protein [Acidobacteriota bacterium]